jgi:molybdopterin biosynthesis enzyme
LASGCAARLFTGAPIPKGANTVVMQEIYYGFTIKKLAL